MNTPKTFGLKLAAFALTLTFAVLPGTAAPKKAARTAPKAAADTVTIINSGDRLSPGYRVTVTDSGAVHGIVRTHSGKTTIDRKGQMIGPTRERLFADLHNAEPLNRLSTESSNTSSTTAPQASPQQGRQGRRGRRGGFGNRPQPNTTYTAPMTGPQVFVLYRGVRSPNLRAASDDKGKELYQRVKQAIEVVRLPIPDMP